jgi:hypothetical protein
MDKVLDEYLHYHRTYTTPDTSFKTCVGCDTAHNPMRTRCPWAGVQFPRGTLPLHPRLPPPGSANHGHSWEDTDIVGETRPPCWSTLSDYYDTARRNASCRNKTKRQSSNKTGTGNQTTKRLNKPNKTQKGTSQRGMKQEENTHSDCCHPYAHTLNSR